MPAEVKRLMKQNQELEDEVQEKVQTSLKLIKDIKHYKGKSIEALAQAKRSEEIITSQNRILAQLGEDAVAGPILARLLNREQMEHQSEWQNTLRNVLDQREKDADGKSISSSGYTSNAKDEPAIVEDDPISIEVPEKIMRKRLTLAQKVKLSGKELRICRDSELELDCSYTD